MLLHSTRSQQQRLLLSFLAFLPEDSSSDGTYLASALALAFYALASGLLALTALFSPHGLGPQKARWLF